MASHRGDREAALAVRRAAGAATKKGIKHVRREDTQSVLTLRLLGASKLRSADSNGLSDPYCEAWVFSMKDQAPEHMWRTATRRRTPWECWDHSPLWTIGIMLSTESSECSMGFYVLRSSRRTDENDSLSLATRQRYDNTGEVICTVVSCFRPSGRFTF